MSEHIFNNSRIPISASPTPLRRHGSLRLQTTPNRATAGGSAPSVQRANSFMEQKNGTKWTNFDRIGLGASATSTPQRSSRNRALSLSLSTARLSAPKSHSTSVSPRTPPTTPDACRNGGERWETESNASLRSTTSLASNCDHASVARNGTTFSGRSMKYVFHCNQHAGATGEDYLTPTQRVHRQVKKLQQLLAKAQTDLDDKDSDILQLTKEVVELRLYKAALNSPEESNSSDAITVREIDEQSTPDRHDDGNPSDMTSSYTDSGHFDDFATSSPRKKPPGVDKEVNVSLDSREHANLIVEYEKRLQELVKMHESESHSLKQKHNDKVEELLQRITEINQRYWELVPELDLAKEKIKELDGELDEACKKLQKSEEQQKVTYLQMYNQGVEAGKSEKEMTASTSRISVPELLEELQVTKDELDNIKDLEYASTSNNLQPLLSAKEALSLWVLGARKAMYRQLVEARNKSKIDPEITLQFLKSAVYYFLTDKENCQGHLKAIQSILGFTPHEISNIDKARLA